MINARFHRKLGPWWFRTMPGPWLHEFKRDGRIPVVWVGDVWIAERIGYAIGAVWAFTKTVHAETPRAFGFLPARALRNPR